MHKVSVIIPVYNAEKYIGECIESILCQTYQNLQILLIDDGSLDNSQYICDDYALKDKRIDVIKQKNSGAASARNAGISLSSGEFICFIDADDYIASDMIEKLLNSMNNADLAINSFMRVDDYNVYNISEQEILSSDPVEILSDVLRNEKFISCCRCLFKKKIINKNNLVFSENIKYGEDQEFTYKYMLHCKSVKFVKNAIYYYRISSSSAMHKPTYGQLQEIDAIKSVLNYGAFLVNEKDIFLLTEYAYNNRFVHSIQVAVINLLQYNESLAAINVYLKENGLTSILENAIVNNNKRYYLFWKLWNISPHLCLNFFRFKIQLGKIKKIYKNLKYKN